MNTTLLSADLPYAEIAFFAIIALGLVLGLIRGFAKSFKGIFLTVAIMLCSLLLITPTFGKVRNVDFVMNIETSLTQKIEGGSEIFALPITVQVDGDGNRTFWAEAQVDGVATQVPIEEAMGDGLLGSTKGKLVLWLAERFITDSNQTIGSVAGIFVTDIIASVVMFVVYCIALWFVCFVLRKIFSKMHKSESKLLKGIDRTCGAVVSTAFAFIFVLLVLAILHAIRDKIPEVDEMISSSTVAGYFYANNPIATLFAEIFG